MKAQDSPAVPRRRRVSRGAPLPLLVPALIGVAFLVLPLIALLVRAPWRSMPDLLTSTEVWQALRLSLVCATAATAVSLVVGVPLAWLLARVEFPGRRLVRATRRHADHRSNRPSPDFDLRSLSIIPLKRRAKAKKRRARAIMSGGAPCPPRPRVGSARPPARRS